LHRRARTMVIAFRAVKIGPGPIRDSRR